ncbi:MAG TPA: class I SAM-dependent methyltransferase [Bryobacteraceae bacterium]|jgi:SAM-dependent methyltransferase
MNDSNYFQARFAPDPRRDVLWRALYRYYFSKLISETDCVLDMGAGYGHFINQVRARRRIAVDDWPGTADHLQEGIEFRAVNAANLSFLETGSVNFAFASNLFEHMTQDEFACVLRHLKRILAAGGTLNILQPNFYYSYRRYFDDYTHRTIYTHTSLCDFLEANGYRVVECRPRFLPLTVKSRLPVSPLLIRLYLASPWKPLSGQMLIRARCV